MKRGTIGIIFLMVCVIGVVTIVGINPRPQSKYDKQFECWAYGRNANC